MHIIKKIARSWPPLAVAFLIGALFVGSASGHPGFPDFLHAGHSDTMAGTLTAKNFRYSSPRTAQVVVPGAAFVAATPADVPDHDNYSGGVILTASEGAVAPVYFPQGAIVTRVTVWHEAVAAGGWQLHLEANDNAGNHDDMVIINAAACVVTPCTTSTTTVLPNTVNNTTRSYGIKLANLSGEEIRLPRGDHLPNLGALRLLASPRASARRHPRANRVLADGWTVVTTDGSLAAPFEHTIAITEDRPESLTAMESWPIWFAPQSS